MSVIRVNSVCQRPYMTLSYETYMELAAVSV